MEQGAKRREGKSKEGEGEIGGEWRERREEERGEGRREKEK